MRRKLGKYFKTQENDPAPLLAKAEKRVSFSDVDIMGIVWHGRYAQYFEEGFAALGRMYDLSYQKFYEEGVRAPIVQMHVDYHRPMMLDEICKIEARLIWNEGARLNIEYSIFKEDGRIAATGYTVQMFMNAQAQEPYLVSPDLLVQCRKKWISGEFQC
ncbi:hypothetical protein MNBD_UNCLBAC01-570 [hydrothermal vent metagenome]|uniref:Uncharacterized protein n=1 Tax=hydrothermal vent metagenome TaxID=652676 RepID=A0A3B1DZR8_9ZZZZ